MPDSRLYKPCLGHKHNSEYYNKALRDKVYEKYKQDFERFGYDPK
jgi:hypothetical protein